jgi:hypothetical protein
MKLGTTVINIQKTDKNSFFVDFLYYGCTSYSKSLRPAIDRAFKKYAKELLGGGSFRQTHEELAVDCGHSIYGTSKPYTIRRVTWAKV